jgi:hypothetical protein
MGRIGVLADPAVHQPAQVAPSWPICVPTAQSTPRVLSLRHLSQTGNNHSRARWFPQATDGLQNPSPALTVGGMSSRHEAIAAVDAVAAADTTRNAQQRQREALRVASASAPVLRPAREYIAVSGDSWWSIASRVSPTPAPHDVLKALHALQLLNPHLTDLTPGTRMHLPDLDNNTA